MFESIINWIKSTTIYKKFVNLPLVVELLKILAKVGTGPLLIGIIILTILGHYSYANSFAGKIFNTIGFSSSYAYLDSIFLKDIETFKEIKSGNVAIALVTAAIFISLSLLWM